MRTPRSRYSYQSSSRWRRESTEDTFRAGHRNGSPGCCAMPTKYWVESGFLWSVRMTLLRLARRLSGLTRRSRRLTAQLADCVRSERHRETRRTGVSCGLRQVRFGSPIGVAESGTEKEFRQASKWWEATPSHTSSSASTKHPFTRTEVGTLRDRPFPRSATGAIGPLSSQPKMRTYLRISQASAIFVSMLSGPNRRSSNSSRTTHRCDRNHCGFGSLSPGICLLKKKR